MRDGFVFYRSFFESFEDLSKKDKLILFDALCNYALNDIVPELTGTTNAIFKLLKPQVDANNRRYENGKKGGRPKANQTETKTKPNDNQTETKLKPKEKEKDKDKDKVKEKDKDKQQDKGLGSSRVRGGGSSDGDEFNIWKKLDGAGIDAIYDVYPESGGFLIEEVAAEVRNNRRTVDNAVGYVLGYAKRVGWDDNADHFDGGDLS
jgi:hypothetical protein